MRSAAAPEPQAEAAASSAETSRPARTGWFRTSRWTLEPRRAREAWRSPRWISFALLAVGLGLMLIGLGAPSFWFDEAATRAATQRSYGQLWGMVHNVDIVHALFYFLFKGWADHTGYSEFAMRVPSALAIALTAVQLFRLCERLFAETAPRVKWWVWAVFLAIPAVQSYAAEARSYPWVMLCVVTLVRVIVGRRPGSPLAALWVFLLVTITTNLHLMSVLLMPGLALWELARRRKVFAWDIVVPYGLAAAATYPLYQMSQQQTFQVKWLGMLQHMWFMNIIRDTYLIIETPARLTEPYDSLTLGICTLLWGAALSSLWRLSTTPTGWLLGVWFIAPLVLLFLVSYVQFPLYQQRYLAYSIPALAILISYFLGHVCRWKWALVMSVVSFIALAPIEIGNRTSRAGWTDDLRKLTAARLRADVTVFDRESTLTMNVAYPQPQQPTYPQLDSPIETNSLFGFLRREEPPHYPLKPKVAIITARYQYDENSPIFRFYRERGCDVHQDTADDTNIVWRADCPPAALTTP